MKLTPHEQKILAIVRQHPEIVNDPARRKEIAKEYGLTEKTLRNRIADLKKYGLVGSYENKETQVFETEMDITIFDYWEIIWKRRKVIISTVLVFTIISVIISLILPKWYKATTIILPPQSNQSSFGMLGALSDLGFSGLIGGNESENRYLAILKSNTLLNAVALRYNLQEKYETENMEKTLNALRENMIINVEDEDQITVSIIDKDQDMVADIANYVIQCLDSINIVLTSSSAGNNRQFIQTQLMEVLDSLNLFEKELIHFMRKEGVLSLDNQIIVGVEKAAEIKSLIMTKEVEYEVTKKLYTPNNPQVKKLKLEIDGLQQQYQSFYNEDGRIDRLIPSFYKIPDLALRFEHIKRKIDYYSTLLKFVGPQYEQAKIEEVKDIPTLQVLDKAVRPEEKYKPKRTLIVLSTFFASLFLSIIFVLTYQSILNYSLIRAQKRL